MACDRWNRIACNIWAIAKTIEAMRGIDRWDVSDMLNRAFLGFKGLPEEGSGRPWWKTLGLNGDVRSYTQDEVKGAFRTLSKKMHPDVGGAPEEWHELQTAYKQAMEATEFDRGVRRHCGDDCKRSTGL